MQSVKTAAKKICQNIVKNYLSKLVIAKILQFSQWGQISSRGIGTGTGIVSKRTVAYCFIP